MADEQKMVEEYVLGVQKMLDLQDWQVLIKWQNSEQHVGCMAVYDTAKHQINLTLNQNMLESEVGVNNLFTSIVNKMVGVLGHEILEMVSKLEKRVARVVINAMGID